MDETRYFLAVLFVVTVPPAVLFWFFIHPFARFWRKLGPWPTYLTVGLVFLILMYVFYLFRGGLTGRDLGTDGLLIGAGCALYVVSAWLSLRIRRHLDSRTFVGLPEVSGGGEGDALIQDGMYGVVRHPRYLAVIVGTAGFAMVVNYLGVYLVWLGSVLGLLLLIPLEERELVDRFGSVYQEYRSRVPALIPRSLFTRRVRRKGSGGPV
jgi:protein-S-isoprenylcysteine O-methyltransferase Ste14